ncbi:phosphatase PAP2 family protein [Streptomyces sp. NPDC046939]|uniref:phosphatase PAP2 family protein n=1 Tax=Streptomyces sp. NPDC046939 TaxID=3155376 RepID=UPI0033C880EB
MNRRDLADLAGSVGLGAGAALGLLTMIVVGRDGAPLDQDTHALHWFLGHRSAETVALARGVTATGTGVVPYALVVLAGCLVGRSARQRLTATALGLLCLAGGQALRLTVMLLVHRPRPPAADWAGHASGWAFPSGHTTTAALTAGILLIAVRLRAPRGGTPLMCAVVLWGLLVGVSRAVLAVHWATDVLAGWLFAAAWAGGCLCAAAWWLPQDLTPARAPAPHDPAEAS